MRSTFRASFLICSLDENTAVAANTAISTINTNSAQARALLPVIALTAGMPLPWCPALPWAYERPELDQLGPDSGHTSSEANLILENRSAPVKE